VNGSLCSFFHSQKPFAEDLGTLGSVKGRINKMQKVMASATRSLDIMSLNKQPLQFVAMLGACIIK
jgi:hypothetical protein